MYQNSLITENNLYDLSLEELLQLEATFARVRQEKMKNQAGLSKWEDDFLSISQWTHLQDETPVEIKSWKIETF